LKYAAGDKDCPYFVVPAVYRKNPFPAKEHEEEEMSITHWADIFGGNFDCPGWAVKS
jgi:hypothetical protein